MKTDRKVTPKEEPRRKMLGEILVDSGLIDNKTLEKALEVQKAQGKRIGQVLIDMGVADDVEIAKALAKQLGIPMVRLKAEDISEKAVSLVPSEVSESYNLIPIRIQGGKLVVAMVNPLEFYAIDDLRFITQMPIEPVASPERDILAALDRYYPKDGLDRGLADVPAGEHIEVVTQVQAEDADESELLKLTKAPPVVRFSNAILADAIKLDASDIHVEPRKTAVIIRYRIDGVMREVLKTDRHVLASLVSRIKIISGMDISIRRKPQDGRAQVRYGGKAFDLRVSTIPTSYGEKVTIRILNPAQAGIQIEDLGMSGTVLAGITEALARPQGILLVTGPTGSGKSSTLYACLNRLNTPLVNIVTVEDPVEYDIEGINQVGINEKAGITFAAGLRSILRQDPDIVMIGEIRDAETARIAFQAAQTGHLVMSTLHTNDAPSAVVRLLDLGVEEYLISSSLISVLGQRLVRRICPHCKVPDPISVRMLEQVFPGVDGLQEASFWKGAGCEACQFTGYKGRLGLFEMFRVTPSIRSTLAAGAAGAGLKEGAAKEGYVPLAADGLEKAGKGLTTVEEVFRVAPPATEDIPPAAFPPGRPASDTGPENDEKRKPLPKPERIPQAVPISVTVAQPAKVLVADDSEIIVKLVSNILETDNCQVRTAANGAEALKMALQEKPDLIVTDYLMPEMDGITLIQRLRAQPSTRHIPIIMLSAKDEVDSEVKGIDAGADDYITKPVNPQRLLARVHRQLDRSRR